MAQPTQLQYPFGGGIDQKTAEQYLDPNQRQVSVVNGNFDKVGALDKRLGIEHLLQVQPPIAQKVFSWSKSNLSVISGANLQAYSPGSNTVSEVGPLPPGKTVRRPVAAPEAGGPPEMIDYPSPNGQSTWRVIIYFTTETVGGIEVGFTKYLVIDANSGDIIVQPTTLIQGIYGVTSQFYQASAPVGSRLRIVVLGILTGTCYLFTASSQGIPTFVQYATLNTVVGGLIGQDVVPFTGDPNGGIVQVYPSSTAQLNVTYWQDNGSTVVQVAAVSYSVAGSLSFPVYAVATYGPRVGPTGGEHVWISFVTVNGGMYQNWYAQMSGDGTFTDELGGARVIQSTGTAHWETSGLTRLSTDFFHWTAVVQVPLPVFTEQGASTVHGTWLTYGPNGNVVGAGSIGPGYFPVAKPFVNVDGNLYQPMYYNLYISTTTAPADVNSEQVTYYLMQYRGLFQFHTDFTNCLPVATCAPRITNQAGQNGTVSFGGIGKLPLTSGGNEFLSSSGKVRWAVGLQVNGLNTGGLSGAQPTTWYIDHFFDTVSESQLYQTSELGQALCISGGVPFISDSASTFEDSFFAYPEFSFINLSGNTAVFDETVSYAAVYFYQDAAGLMYQSVPFFMGTVTPINGQAINLYLLNYTATWRDLVQAGDVFIQIFRTTDEGSTFFLTTVVQASSNPGNPLYTLYPNENADDQDIQVATIIYTTGGVLDQPNPPVSNFQIAHKTRKALVDDTLRTVWFSQQYIDGLAPSYNEGLTQEFPDGGDITAIASMDANFIVFKQRRIFVMNGDGPTQTGANSDWTIPYQIPTDVGCISVLSLVTTPVGILFQAENGMYLLDRSLSVNFIGTVVQDITQEFPTCTSATLVPDAQQVRWTMTNGVESVTLVYDYLLKQWTTHEYAQFQTPVASACLTYQVPTRYSLLTLDGHLWQEHLPTDSNAYLDANTSGIDNWVPLFATTAWVKFQIQAYQQCRWVQFYGLQSSNCGIQLSLQTNYVDNVPVQIANWLDTQLATLPIPGQVQMYLDRRYNIQQSVQVSVLDTAPSNGVLGTGQGMRFVNLSFDINQLGQMYPQVAVGGRR